MAARRYAATTDVPVSRSRAAIDKLLRQWGCSAIRWTDDFDSRVSMLEFTWTHEDVPYHARLKLDHRVPGASAKEQDQRSRSLHRVLLMKVKSDLNCVDAGLVTGVEVFLSHLVGADGRTVAEIAAVQLPMLLKSSAARLLEAPGA